MPVTLAANALTTVEQVKSLTGLTGDDQIKFRINAASDLIERLTGRSFGIAEITAEQHQGRGRPELILNRFPITELDEIREDGEAVDEDDYIVNAESGIVTKNNGYWPWAPGYHQDLTNDPDSSQAEFNIEADYTAGYVLPKDEAGAVVRSLPYYLELACIELVQWFADRSIGIKSEHIGNYSYEVDSATLQGGIPSGIMAVIDRYKVAVLA